MKRIHYWGSDADENLFTLRKNSEETPQNAFLSRYNILAGWPHMHFYANPKFASGFIAACLYYARETRD